MSGRRASPGRSAILVVLAACGPATEEAAETHVTGPCDAAVTWAELPEEVRETSGVAASRAHRGVFWTHNDSGGDSAVFALDSSGTVLARVRVRGATNRDWEDLALGPCAADGGGDCLFIGDIGDNSEQRERVVVYRVPEPDPRADTVTARAVRIEATYPDGPRDAEGLFVTPAGLHLVTKGRSHAIELYRLQPPFRPGRARPLEKLQDLAPPPTSVTAQVTAAAASPDGQTAVIRTYSGLRFFEIGRDSLRPLGRPADFIGFSQPQGEGVDFINGNRLVLTGEAGGRTPATIAATRCDPRAPDTPADSLGP